MASAFPQRYRSPSRLGSLVGMTAAAVLLIAAAGVGYPAIRRDFLADHDTTVEIAGVRELAVTDAARECYGVLSATEILDARGAVSGYRLVCARQGYRSEIRIQCTFAADRRTLAAARVLSQQETEYLGARISTEEFSAQLSGRRAPLKLWRSATVGSPIDGLSGSTVSAQAVVDAVNGAYDYLQQTAG